MLLVVLHDLVLDVSGLWRVLVRVRRNVNRTHMCSLWCSIACTQCLWFGEGQGEECKQNSHVFLVVFHDLVLNVSGLVRV